MLEVVRTFFLVSFSKTRGEAALGSEPLSGLGLGLRLGLELGLEYYVGWVDALSRFDGKKITKTRKNSFKTFLKWNIFVTLSGAICGTKPRLNPRCIWPHAFTDLQGGVKGVRLCMPYWSQVQIAGPL